MKKIIAIVLTLIIFIIILLNINIKELMGYFYNINLIFFLTSFLFYIPMYLILGERWKAIIYKDYNISLKESVKMCMAGATLNSIVPSKIGEFSKAYFLKKNNITLKRGLNLVLFEKICDIFSICILFLIGLFLINKYNYLYTILIIFCIFVILCIILYFNINFEKSKIFRKIFWIVFKYEKLRNIIIDTQEFINSLKCDKIRIAYILYLSLLSWFIQLSHIYFLFLSLNYFVPIKLVLGLVPAAMLIGLIPITLGGMGTRDSTLIFLFLEYAPTSLIASIGILISTRYFVCSLIGLPFFREYMSK